MSKRNIHQYIEENFTKAEKDDWLHVAKKELGEKKSLESLSWNVDSLVFSPYYDKSDVSDLKYLEDYQKVLVKHAGSFHSGWRNIPGITVSSESIANKTALQFLERGADGLLFDAGLCYDIDVAALLENIHWDMCSLSFLTHDTKMVTKVLAYARQKNYDLEKLDSTLFYKPSVIQNSYKQDIAPFSKISGVGIVVPSSSPVEEISYALMEAVEYMETLEDETQAATFFRSLRVLMNCDDNFLLTISKFKSLRMLWSQLARAFNVNDYSPTELHLHVCSKGYANEKFEPHGQMISNTIDAVAAVTGGCNSLTLLSAHDDADMISRIALNISHILKEESHIDKVFDPLAGAYSIDRMVHEMAREAWQQFQNMQS